MTLTQFFQTHRQVALGFSGGVDSAYLLYAAIQAGAAVGAYVVHSPFQPDFELQDALRLAQRLGAECQILQADPLALPQVAENPPDRCYHCKKVIFSAIAQAAGPGACLIDGTNASDDIAGRPGYRALQELGVLSPLRLCGLAKGEIRRLSQAAGLFTWDKPAYACLATRIPTGTPITPALLDKTQKAEAALSAMGFRDFRVRYLDGRAKLQLKAEQMPMALARWAEILTCLAPHYTEILLDLEARP